MEETKNCLNMAMFAVWAGSLPGWLECVWDERRIQMSGPILFSFDCYEMWGYQRYSYPHGILKFFLKN
jgi:hypothetical protein